MTEVKLTDPAGKTIALIEYDDKLYPAFTPETITNMKSLKLRDDDIIISAYPKSGTHWMYEICRMLLAGRTNGLEIISKVSMMIERTYQAKLDAEKSPRILNSHVRFNNLPTDMATKKPKIIYIARNPKDLVVSFYNHCYKISHLYHYTGEFKDFLQLFADGNVEYNSWFDYVRDWEKVIAENKDFSILDLRYEDLKEKPNKEIRKISDFLGLETPDELIDEIADVCSFSKMEKRKGHILADETGKSKIYRKGEVGDWKNWFTVAQNEWFDRLYQERMKGSKLQFRYTLSSESV